MIQLVMTDFLSELSDDLEAVTPLRPMRMVLAWLAAALLYVGGCVWMAGLRPDFEMRWEMMYQAELLLALCVTVNSGVAALLLSIPDTRKRYGLLALPLVALCLLSVVVLLSGEISAHSLEASLKADHLMVTARLCLYALLPCVFLFAAVRRAAPTRLALTGGMLCLAASASAYMILRLTMPGDNIANVLIWCYLPVVLLAMLGALLGRKLLRW